MTDRGTSILMFSRPWPPSFPLPGKTLILICIGFLVTGLIGHDPWKTDDVVSLAIARSILDGNWLIPQLAGEPWLQAPPLFHWLAALSSLAFGSFFPWHDAARLASVFLAALGLANISYAARTLYDADAGKITPLLVIGTLGLLVPFHDAQPALVTFAALAVMLAALAAWRRHPLRAGCGAGIATGMAFLGGGMDALVLLLSILLLCGAHPRWRHESFRAWLVALVTALPLLSLWPMLLQAQAPAAMDQWWAFESQSMASPMQIDGRRLEFLAWALWPVLPLGMWAIWLERKNLFAAQTYLPLIAAIVGSVHFFRSSEITSALLPVAAAWALLATQSAHRLRRGAASAFDWFSVMTLTLFITLAWVGGIAILTGLPERIAKNFSIPAPGFIPQWSWPALSLAVLVTLLWMRLLISSPRSPWRPVSRWACGVVAVWTLLAMLWMPWINYTKSYRIPSGELRNAIGGITGCIERDRLGPAQRASLDYFAGIRTLERDDTRRQCKLRIVQATPEDEKIINGWRLIHETSRPGDKRERLRLYRRRE